MTFIKKIWKNRVSQYPNRYSMAEGTSSSKRVTIVPDNGNVSEEGDVFDAATMNDLEDRIEDAVEPIDSLTNPNLLDNPWFTVNQRGQSTYTGASAYCVDRWYRNRNNNTVEFDVAVTTDGITVTKLATYGGRIWQKLESIDNLVGRTVTMTILYKSTIPLTMGLSESSGGNIPLGMSVPASATWTYATRTGTVPSSMTAIYFAMTLLNSTDPGTFDIKAVKLELGSVSTLAMDTAPNYAIELAKCKASTADNSDTYANQGDIATTKWKHLPEVTSSTHVSLPSAFNELHIKIRGIYSNTYYSYHIDFVKEDFSEAGYYLVGFNNGQPNYVQLYYSSTEIYVAAYQVNNTSVLSTTKLNVYYR